jgi:hypothetical protein
VYIVTRSLGSKVKVTLHAARPERGLEQEGHTRLPTKAVPAPGEKPHSTIAVKWKGQEVADGIHRQFLLYVPTAGLRAFQERDATSLQWILPPPIGYDSVVEVCIGRRDVRWGPSGATLLAEAPLCDGRVVRAFCGALPTPAEPDVSALLRRIADQGAHRMLSPGIRLLLFGENAGAGTFIELAADMLPAK